MNKLLPIICLFTAICLGGEANIQRTDTLDLFQTKSNSSNTQNGKAFTLRLSVLTTPFTGNYTATIGGDFGVLIRNGHLGMTFDAGAANFSGVGAFYYYKFDFIARVLSVNPGIALGCWRWENIIKEENRAGDRSIYNDLFVSPRLNFLIGYEHCYLSIEPTIFIGSDVLAALKLGIMISIHK